MKNFIKGKFATVLILIVTVALAGIAIFTAFRLYQLRQESVAPNAPSSIPHAAVATATPKACQALTFTIGGTEIPACTGIIIYKKTGTTYTVIKAQDVVLGNTLRLGALVDKHTASTKAQIRVSIGTTVDKDWTDAQTNATGTGAAEYYIGDYVVSKSGAFKAEGKIDSGTVSAVCSVSLTVAPISPVSCSESCTTSADCGSGLTCSGNMCRNNSCPSEADCICPTATPAPTATPTAAPGTPNSCGGTCGSNANCESNLICSSGFCRNPSCPSASNCSCPAAASTSTPAPEAALPVAGIAWPTIAGFTLGSFVLILALVLAL